MSAVTPGPSAGPMAGLRLAQLYVLSRRVPVALAAIAVSAVALWTALHWRWTAYGAFQLPLIFEAACATVVAATTASPFGEPERAAGRQLPWLRLGTALALTAAAAVALAAAGIGTDLAGGILEMVRNLIGLTGIGLLCAALLGAALAWTAPAAYLLVAVYALYTRWHGPALTGPWIWPAQPLHDISAAACAGLVFIAGLAVFALRGARNVDPDGGSSDSH
ncbi:hypothetical protein [Catellatospora citrea]|uniref:Uncharacterized protein n=1 Tax=Catellatospora citrea TaxID=53366 RepID=A0A8J3NZZ6_9ACTN|nr:hypothetical protein [Catellatospora citrea]RKE12173.1 hypothetical protein C8E86_7110 [Catellatospora citrea]GIF98863.1 hypothetical protein Cci01nite_39570 [Catellatospora citrea]